MGWFGWLSGTNTGSKTGSDKSNNTTYHKSQVLKGSEESHDHTWVRTDTYPSGATRTVMGETGRNSVARDEGRSADRSGPRGGNADRGRESR